MGAESVTLKDSVHSIVPCVASSDAWIGEVRTLMVLLLLVVALLGISSLVDFSAIASLVVCVPEF